MTDGLDAPSISKVHPALRYLEHPASKEQTLEAMPWELEPSEALEVAYLTCKENFDGTLCDRPATHLAGGYPACPRCANFWSPEFVHELTERERGWILLGVRLATAWWA